MRVVLPLIWLAACGLGDAGVDAAPIAERMHTYVVPPGDFVELRVPMAEGSQATIDSTAAFTLVWEVHIHENLSTYVLVDGQDAAGAIPFTATPEGIYGWPWSNDTNVYWTPASAPTARSRPPSTGRPGPTWRSRRVGHPPRAWPAPRQAADDWLAANL